VRAGAPLAFPTATVEASTIFPDLDKYRGPPLEIRPHGGDRASDPPLSSNTA